MAAVGFGFNQAVFAVVGKTLITIRIVPLADVTPSVVGEAQVFPGLEAVVWAQGLGGAQVAGRDTPLIKVCTIKPFSLGPNN
ncbi:hypothetical protein GCM10009425_28410 [Pseudomonas asuensis]|uniref:Uncharacterized protein n=1 Tax=Pseudomonas asuensis TaxID=1825787 RepID=A0ABQ2GXH2_9PSED|nr:hypothetical protein GCM10009425_28410 [Pseudomonas asuensis]